MGLGLKDAYSLWRVMVKQNQKMTKHTISKKNNLDNIFVFHGDAIEIVESFFPDNSLDHIYIFFPDPWPKKKHRKRRIINLYSIDVLFNKLKKNGKFHFTTDNKNYAYSVRNVL